MRLLSAIACECDLDLCHFDVDQAFVQSRLEENVFLRLPRGCGKMSGKVVRLNKSLYGLKQASRTWHAHLTTCLLRLGFEQCLTDVCVFRLIEDGRVTITAVVHVDDIFAVGQKERCDRLCVDLYRTIPVKNLGELKWYGGCRYLRDRKTGTLTISQQSFTRELVNKFDVTSVQNIPLRVGLKLDEFDVDEKTENRPFRELVGGLTWLAISTRPDISTQFDLFQGTVPRQKPFIGKQRSVFLRTSMVLLTLALRIKEGHFFRGFCRRRLRQQSDRQEICVWRSHYVWRSMCMMVF